MQDLYKILGVSNTATEAEIRTAYKKLSLKHHPDRVQDAALKVEATKKFQEITEAHSILSDADKRRMYDAEVRLERTRNANGCQPEAFSDRGRTSSRRPSAGGFETRAPRWAEDDDDYVSPPQPPRPQTSRPETPRSQTPGPRSSRFPNSQSGSPFAAENREQRRHRHRYPWETDASGNEDESQDRSGRRTDQHSRPPPPERRGSAPFHNYGRAQPSYSRPGTPVNPAHRAAREVRPSWDEDIPSSSTDRGSIPSERRGSAQFQSYERAQPPFSRPGTPVNPAHRNARGVRPSWEENFPPSPRGRDPVAYEESHYRRRSSTAEVHVHYHYHVHSSSPMRGYGGSSRSSTFEYQSPSSSRRYEERAPRDEDDHYRDRY